MSDPNYSIASQIGTQKTPTIMDTLKAVKDTKSTISSLQSLKNPQNFAFSPNTSDD